MTREPLIVTRSRARRVPLCLLGPGRVGQAWAAQLLADREPLLARAGLRLCLIAMADSSGLVAAVKEEIDDESLRSLIDHKSRGQPLASYRPGGETPGAEVADVLDPAATEAFGETPILIDASAADSSLSLLDARGAGWQLALANKLPLTGPYAQFERLTQGGRGARWETTVASALPVVATLQRLSDQGDQIRWITGTLSGTLGYLAKSLTGGGRLSTAVAQAIRDGLAEPDPRADLGGTDVARKALILARMAGLHLELDDIATESLYPIAWNTLGLEAFQQRLTTLDGSLASRFREAHDHGATMRYAATIGRDSAAAGWVTLDEASPLARIDPADSAVVFETSRFRERPLVISGRGGGPETTAAGLMADVIDLARA